MSTLLKKLIKKPELVKVYSHPRSGTHFLEAFLGENFYRNRDLRINELSWGHWSNRKENLEGNPYGKLFGNHYFADRNKNSESKIYIVRDGRAVAYSIWKTDNFINGELAGSSFSDFLRAKIDWQGSPGMQVAPAQNIIEHWYEHIKSWMALEKTDDNLLLIRYEELLDDPYGQYEKIHSKFFRKRKKLKSIQIDSIKTPLGLLPNKGTKDAWKNVFTKEDSNCYFSIVPKDFL